MADHEGHVKEIVWEFQETGEHEGAIFPVLKDYLPEEAPERLLPHTQPHTAAHCVPAACTATVGISAGSALEAALATALLGALLAFLYSQLVLRRRRQPGTPTTADDPSAPLILADFPRFPQADGGPTCSDSSFVTKTEAFMRFAGIPYTKQAGFPSPASSPKGQLPCLLRGDQRISDSHFIIKHLISSGTAPACLHYPESPRDKAAAIAVARMCDTDLAVAIAYYRWVDDEGWARCRQAMLGPYRLLAPVGWVLGRMIRKSCYIRTMEQQGIGRHSDADRLSLVEEELAALANLLGEQPYLFGDSLHAVDASAFGVLDQMAARGLNPQLTDLLEQFPNLVAYRERIRARYFEKIHSQEVERVGAHAARGGRSRSGLVKEE